MAGYRLSRSAERDVARILAASIERWGLEASHRYAALLIAALRKVAADPEGPATRNRSELAPGIRSFHTRHARDQAPGPAVRSPVHVLIYRMAERGTVEIVRVLHDRMEPRLHIED